MRQYNNVADSLALPRHETGLKQSDRTSAPGEREAGWLSRATGLLAALAACAICIVRKQPWYTVSAWTALTGLVSASVTWFLLSWLFVGLRVWLWAKESRTGCDLDGDGVVGKPPPSPARHEITVNIEEALVSGRKRVDRCVLFSPDSRPSGLAFYAAALIRQDKTRAAFSYAGGKHVNGAQFYGYTPKEFEDLEREARRAGLVYRENKYHEYEITPRGHVVLDRVAEKELAEIQLSPTPESV
jgi:hypothetical protein